MLKSGSRSNTDARRCRRQHGLRWACCSEIVCAASFRLLAIGSATGRRATDQFGGQGCAVCIVGSGIAEHMMSLLGLVLCTPSG
eukprot:3751591-Alexandrium_andersonii.AAC.1